MGIPITPFPDPYGNDCLQCYDAGKTPQILYAIFKGIAIGDLWDDDWPGPPNHVFQIIQDGVDNCKWSYVGDVWTIEYDATFVGPGLGQTLLNVTLLEPFAETAFTGWTKNPCGSKFNNEIWDKTMHPYIGGAAWIFKLTI